MVALAIEADDALGMSLLGMAQSTRWRDPQRHPFSPLAFPPGTNGIPLPDARAVHTDPNPTGRDLAVASKTFGQMKKEGECKSMTRQHPKRNLSMETRLIVFVYRRLSWLVGARSRLLLTTTGRRSGRERTVPVLYMRDGGNYVVVASNAGSDRHPGWYLNCKFHSAAHIQIGRTKVAVMAEEPGAEDRERLWAAWLNENPRYQSQQEQTERQFPMLLLTPVTLR
jgi:deazaflavin-dependent oxidoreductase (nitroreductase family)